MQTLGSRCHINLVQAGIKTAMLRIPKRACSVLFMVNKVDPRGRLRIPALRNLEACIKDSHSNRWNSRDERELLGGPLFRQGHRLFDEQVVSQRFSCLVEFWARNVLHRKIQ